MNDTPTSIDDTKPQQDPIPRDPTEQDLHLAYETCLSCLSGPNEVPVGTRALCNECFKSSISAIRKAIVQLGKAKTYTPSCAKALYQKAVSDTMNKPLADILYQAAQEE